MVKFSIYLNRRVFIMDERVFFLCVFFYYNNDDLLPSKPKLSFRYLKVSKNVIGSMLWLQLIKLLIMLLLCEDFIISIL